MKQNRYRFAASGIVLLLFCLAVPSALAATAPQSLTLGGTRIILAEPPEHVWINKKREIALLLAPKRYRNLIPHIASIYAYPSHNSLAAAYNNYSCLFFVGPKNKVWTKQDFAELTRYLLPEGKEQDAAHTAEGSAFLRALLRDGMQFDVSEKRSEKYFAAVHQGIVLAQSPTSAVVARHNKEKGQKNTHAILALALIRDKLIGLAYYQVAPDAMERERAERAVAAWQKELIAANQ